MAYTKTTWTDGVTPLSSTNMTKIEVGLLAAHTVYGTCSTAAATAAKQVTWADFVLSAQIPFVIAFTNVNTAASPTISFNSGTAIAINVDGSAASATQVPKYALLQYNGSVLQLLNPTGAQIATGSYTGTGTYGSSNPITIPTDFPAKMIVIKRNTAKTQYAGNIAIFINPSTYGFIFTIDSGSTASFADATAAWNSSNMQFYNTSDADRAMNTNGIRFDYAILG